MRATCINALKFINIESKVLNPFKLINIEQGALEYCEQGVLKYFEPPPPPLGGLILLTKVLQCNILNGWWAFSALKMGGNNILTPFYPTWGGGC